MTWKPGADEVARAVDDLRAMERHVTLSHGDTRYFECGTGPAVLLLHGVGYTAGGSNWLFNLRALSAGRRVIAPDLAGFGTGGRLAQPYSFAYLVDFVREFQDALGLPSSDVVGHSMGGWVASLLAYESPDRVGRLVLVASGGTATRPLASMTRFTPPARAAHDEAVAQRLALPAEAAAPLAELEWRAASVPGAAEAYQRLLDHMTDPETRQRYSTVRRLPLVTAPTLVLWGKDDTVNDPAMGTTTASLLPDARLTLLDCGHAVPTQAAPAFNEAVSGFLSPAPAGPR